MMGPEAGGALAGMLCVLVVAFSIGCLIAAVILRAAAQWGENLDIPFGDAFLTVFLTLLANLAIAFPMGIVVGMSGGGKEATQILQLALLPVGFLVQAGVIGSRHNLPFGSACKVTAIMYGIYFAIVAVAVGVIIGVMFSMR